MSDDLVKRLREGGCWAEPKAFGMTSNLDEELTEQLCMDAAERIDALTAERDKLRDVLHLLFIFSVAVSRSGNVDASETKRNGISWLDAINQARAALRELEKAPETTDDNAANEQFFLGLLSGQEEIVGAGYSRQPIAFSADAEGFLTNTGPQEFKALSGDWGAISHVGIFNGSGKRLLRINMSRCVVLAEGDTLTFASGKLCAPPLEVLRELEGK